MAPATHATPRERTYLREGLLLLGFLLVLAAAIVTVAIPELSKEPEAVGTGRAPAAGAQKRESGGPR
jgi:hypothetical protein